MLYKASFSVINNTLHIVYVELFYGRSGIDYSKAPAQSTHSGVTVLLFKSTPPFKNVLHYPYSTTRW